MPLDENELQIQVVFSELFSFNKFSVLKIESIIEDSDSNDITDTFDNPQKFTLMKATGKRLQKITKTKMEEKGSSSERLKIEATFVSRCKGCFSSHFPYKKFCNWSKLRKGNADSWMIGSLSKDKRQLLAKFLKKEMSEDIVVKNTVRLSGGAGVGGSTSSNLVDRAIESAKKHGINLIQGTISEGDGNCAFNAVINNINQRNCYSNKIELSSTDCRQIWVTELEMEASKYPTLGAGYSEEEKRENWNILKQPGVYEIDFLETWSCMLLPEAAIRIS
jgi:hypothetical protein